MLQFLDYFKSLDQAFTCLGAFGLKGTIQGVVICTHIALFSFSSLFFSFALREENSSLIHKAMHHGTSKKIVYDRGLVEMICLPCERIMRIELNWRLEISPPDYFSLGHSFSSSFFCTATCTSLSRRHRTCLLVLTSGPECCSRSAEGRPITAAASAEWSPARERWISGAHGILKGVARRGLVLDCGGPGARSEGTASVQAAHGVLVDEQKPRYQQDCRCITTTPAPILDGAERSRWEANMRK